MSLSNPSATLTIPTLLTLSYSPAGLEYTPSSLLAWALALVANPLLYIILGLAGTLAYLYIVQGRLVRLAIHHRDMLQLLNDIVPQLVSRSEAGLAALRQEVMSRIDEVGRLHSVRLEEMRTSMEEEWRLRLAEVIEEMEERVVSTRRQADTTLDEVAAQIEREFATVQEVASLKEVLRLQDGVLASLEYNLETARRILRGGDEEEGELRLGDDVEVFWPPSERSEGGDGLGEAPEEVRIDVGECVRICEEWLGKCWEVEEMEDVWEEWGEEGRQDGG